MPDNAYVIPDQDSDWVPNRPVPPREPADGALRRLVETNTHVIPDTPDPKPRSLMGDVADNSEPEPLSPPVRPAGLHPGTFRDPARAAQFAGPPKQWAQYDRQSAQSAQKQQREADSAQRDQQQAAAAAAKEEQKQAKQAAYTGILSKGGVPDYDQQAGTYKPRIEPATGRPAPLVGAFGSRLDG